MDLTQKSVKVKQLAQQLGFFFCGIAEAGFLDEEARFLEKWLAQGKHGSMNWMENHFDKRVDPTKLVPGSKSVISLAINYYNPEQPVDPYAPRVSMYALGRDYHKVIKKKLKSFIKELQNEFGHIEGRAFVDSAPVMDKAWAKKAGIGWIGKNTNLINKKAGSFFFLCELILDLELAYDAETKDYCGTCSKCQEACPTGALDHAYTIDATKCISYLTIELKEHIPAPFKSQMKNWAYGCDICQEVCPWNRLAQPHMLADFNPKNELMNLSKGDWEELTQDVFERLFTGSAVKRAGFNKLKSNIKLISLE